jgi:fructose-bisphosphate aldolase class I
MDTRSELQATIAKIIEPGKGILAADESMPTITKRFEAVGIDSTEQTRRAYRSLLCGTPGAGQYLSGVILFEETLGQKADDGTPFAQWLTKLGILPGIKVDKGTTPLAGAPGDLVTQGLDGLAERLQGYKAQGALFTEAQRDQA